MIRGGLFRSSACQRSSSFRRVNPLFDAAFRKSEHQSMAIITKTHQQSKLLFRALKPTGAHLLTTDSTSFKNGVIITTAHLAKGLEFDEVVVPFASARNYHTDVDQRMLYIACTRAMHQLTLTCSGDLTPLIAL